MKKKIIRAAAAILVLTVALSFAFSGCSNKKDGGDETTTMPPEAVEAVQTLKLPYSKGDKLNPFTATSMLNQQLMPLIYDGLFALDKNYTPQPLLASNYSRSGRTLTVSLASGNVPASGNPGNEASSSMGKIRMLYDKVTGKAEKEVLYFRAYLKQQLTKSLFQTRSERI